MIRVWLCCCLQDQSETRESSIDSPEGVPSAGRVRKHVHSQALSSTVLDTTNDHMRVKEDSLILEVVASEAGAKGVTLRLTPSGLEGSLRKATDGVVYVGSSPPTVKLVDFSMEQDRAMMARRHFSLAYEKGAYYLADSGSATGTFIKVHRSFPLHPSLVVSFGEVYVQTTLTGSFLRLKVLSGNNKGEEKTYTPESSPILIGRTANCGLVFKDSKLSRYQCSLVYEAKAGWVLFDGLNTAKPSTNGTWVYTKDRVQVWDGLLFKAGSSLFKVTLV